MPLKMEVSQPVAPPRRPAPVAVSSTARSFDLNIERVLEHWSIAYALREVIANALDEQALTGTQEPIIGQDRDGCWHVRDFGRGLQYEHLTQNENGEKLEHPGLVVGKFGVGLKDALATLQRHGVSVDIRSRHCNIAVQMTPKHGFDDIVTLHAMIAAPSHPHAVGTDFRFGGVSADDVAQAKAFFLKYAGDEELEKTPYGSVLRNSGPVARIYVSGLCVAEEPNFLFSYNVTSVTTGLRRALNRERTNVGRTAYTDRIKAILLASRGPVVTRALTDDLARFQDGADHDELRWVDVAVHACRTLNASERVVFVTPEQLRSGGALIDYALEDGLRMAVVPGAVRDRLPSLTDTVGQPLRDLDEFRTEYNSSFEYALVRPDDLTPAEQSLYRLSRTIIRMAFGELPLQAAIIISETMRPSVGCESETVGAWEADTRRIVIRRDQLRSLETYASTLLHEAVHAITGTCDLSLAFERELSLLVGRLAEQLLAGSRA